jgi:hypothetical protein
MSLTLMTRPHIEATPEADSPEDIAEMMAEAARVDAMFQSGAISTLFPYAFISTPAKASNSDRPIRTREVQLSLF